MLPIRKWNSLIWETAEPIIGDWLPLSVFLLILLLQGVFWLGLLPIRAAILLILPVMAGEKDHWAQPIHDFVAFDDSNNDGQ